MQARRAGGAAGRIGRCAPLPREASRFIVPARFASEITLCEGAAAMVARKSAKKTVAGKSDTERTTAHKAAAKKAAARRAVAEEGDGKAVARKAAAEKGAAVKPVLEQTGAAEEAADHPVARKTAARKTPEKKAAAGKTAAAAHETAEAAKAPTGKTVTSAGKTAAKKAAAKKAPAKRTAAKDMAAGDATTGGTTAEDATAAGTAAGKAARTVAHKAEPDEKSTAKKAGAARAAKQTGATKVVAKKTPGTATAQDTAVPKARLAAADPGELAVRPGEDPWTDQEVAEARAELQSEMERLRREISSSEESLVGLMRDSGDGAGDDQADTGTKNITREHELALAANAREMLTQTERALERLDAGTYGLCENCGNPIGKARMQAFPRATLCVECKQKQERRS
ncbi:TraR/DksA family transcriptional regulator [Streptomyces sp. SID6137]|nr:TraR/DksA family transcriptional regulator [Streptomyces sp. SID6139]MYR18104.1 TraR/DksA family transcriptional regulator [Streptomyces sp. SID6137]